MKELEEKFENFLFHIDDYVETLIENAQRIGFELNFSLQSLINLEKYLIQKK
ncbi:hypothetical protein [Chryseobacterium sp.]|uniref:hypothetical protein n=1 Tax=Chryseobacterium sp. TaxID=1871047 RepID=UPI00289BC225|nr:hypothetical protein [Chryseobacterium sp.]